MRVKKIILLLLVCISPVIIFLFIKKESTLDQILNSGVLRIAIKENPAYFYSVKGSEGFEYDLAKHFADFLKIDLEPVNVEFEYQIIPMVKLGKATIGAPGPVPETLDKTLEYGPVYNWATQQVIYRHGSRRPNSIDDIRYGDLHLSPKIQLLELMQVIEKQHPQFSWIIHDDKSIQSLLWLVNSEALVSTVTNSGISNVYRFLYPELRVAFDISDLKPVRWIVKKQGDDSLIREVNRFFREIDNNGTLAKLRERYFGHFDKFNYVDIKVYLKRIESRLPLYEEFFRNAANKYNLDWKLLAAISYQESHWDKKARSPTGVRGLMMLTLDTARHVGINNRNDPEQSIDGGTRYLLQIGERIPDRIREPDRMWFTLAAYNVGFNHLEDARILTQKLGGDPDEWIDVRQNLPLLSQEEWYEQTKFGYARGNEPVKYVEKIRRYYDILTWIKYLENKGRNLKAQGKKPPNALSMDSPVL